MLSVEVFLETNATDNIFVPTGLKADFTFTTGTSGGNRFASGSAVVTPVVEGQRILMVVYRTSVSGIVNGAQFSSGRISAGVSYE
jgi:hypothetical protein